MLENKETVGLKFEPSSIYNGLPQAFPRRKSEALQNRLKTAI